MIDRREQSPSFQGWGFSLPMRAPGRQTGSSVTDASLDRTGSPRIAPVASGVHLCISHCSYRKTPNVTRRTETSLKSFGYSNEQIHAEACRNDCRCLGGSLTAFYVSSLASDAERGQRQRDSETARQRGQRTVNPSTYYVDRHCYNLLVWWMLP